MCHIFAGAEAAKQRVNEQINASKTKEKAETQNRATVRIPLYREEYEFEPFDPEDERAASGESEPKDE